MVALVDAMTCYNIDRHTVSILSLGCGDQELRITPNQIKFGGLFYWKKIILSAMHLQSQSALGQAGLLIGRERLLRINSEPSLDPIGLDDYQRAAKELPKIAKKLVEDNSAQLEKFFDGPRDEYVSHYGSRSTKLSSSE